MTFNKIFIFLAVLCLVPKLSNAQPQESLMTQWNNAMLSAVVESRTEFPLMIRIYAIVHNAMYNAWAYYDDKAISDPPTLFERKPEADRTLENKEAAISYAAYYSVTQLLKNQVAIFTALMTSLGYPTAVFPTDPKSPAGIGARVALELIKGRRNDNSNELGDLNPSGAPYSEPSLLINYKEYKYINTVDKLNNVNYWQPQRNSDGTAQLFATPHWGAVQPFAMKSGAQYRPKKCAKKTCTDFEGFVEQAQQIYDLSKNLTPKQRLIAIFWDNQLVPALTPWHLIASEIASRDDYTLDEEVKINFALSNALFDASIACWDTKRVCNSVRPKTVINKFIDPTWETLPEISTPNHPDFTSAHAVLAAAAAEILREITGSDYYGGSYTDSATGITLEWKTFTDVVVQGSISRMYAGIHFEDAVEVGQKQGRKVGRTVWEKLDSLFRGKIDECEILPIYTAYDKVL